MCYSASYDGTLYFNVGISNPIQAQSFNYTQLCFAIINVFNVCVRTYVRACVRAWMRAGAYACMRVRVWLFICSVFLT